MAAKTKTSAYVDDALIRKVKIAAAERGTNQTEAIEQGLRWWLTGEVPSSQPCVTEGLERRDRESLIALAELYRDPGKAVDFVDAIRRTITAAAKIKASAK